MSRHNIVAHFPAFIGAQPAIMLATWKKFSAVRSTGYIRAATGLAEKAWFQPDITPGKGDGLVPVRRSSCPRDDKTMIKEHYTRLVHPCVTRDETST